MATCAGTVTLCVNIPQENPIQVLFPANQFLLGDQLRLALYTGTRQAACVSRIDPNRPPLQTWDFTAQSGTSVQSELIRLTETGPPVNLMEDEFFFQLFSIAPTGNCLSGLRVDFSGMSFALILDC